MFKKSVKYYTIVRSDIGKVQIDADFYRIDAGVYIFYKHDEHYIPRNVYEVSMLFIKELESNYREENT